jgi:hypothetical protein
MAKLSNACMYHTHSATRAMLTTMARIQRNHPAAGEEPPNSLITLDLPRSGRSRAYRELSVISFNDALGALLKEMQGSHLQAPPYFSNVTPDGKGQFNWNFVGVSKDKVWLHKPLVQKGLSDNRVIDDQCTAEVMPSLEVLPARCATSPMLAMLRYDERQPFVPVTTTTLRSIWSLYQMQLYFQAQQEVARQMGNHELYRALKRAIEEDPEVGKLKMYSEQKQNAFYGAPGDAKSKLPAFVELMWDLTMRHIHMLERRMHACTVLMSKNNKDIRPLFTPNAMVPEDFPYDPAQEAKDSLDMQNWFQTKQSNYIAQETAAAANANAAGGGVSVSGKWMFIDHEHIVPALQDHRRDPARVWRSSVPWRTLWQYMLFQDNLGLKNMRNEKP